MAGARRCRPTRRSRSACSRSWRPGATRLRVRLLTLAVVDDLVALLVIATAYTEQVELVPLIVAAALFATLFALRYAPPEWRLRAAVIVGVAIWVALLKSGIDPGDRGARRRAHHRRLSAGPRRPRARRRADALVPRAADARSGAVRAAGRGVGDLAQRAPPAPPASVDELRHRAAVRARQRRHPRRRVAARGRRHVADHARDRPRLRDRQAARHRRRHVARLPRLRPPGPPHAELAGPRRRRRRGRHRVHRRAADLDDRLRRRAGSRRPSSAC